MHFLVRADASKEIGTGHLMRCLTLGRELRDSGHEVEILTNASGIPWLEDYLVSLGFRVFEARPSILEYEKIKSLNPNFVIVDSYSIDAEEISELDEEIPVIFFSDGDDRSVRSSITIDQNLGTIISDKAGSLFGVQLTGAAFALIRQEIIAAKRAHPWKFNSKIPKILVLLGGTDPLGHAEIIINKLRLRQDSFSARVVASNPNKFKSLESDRDDSRIEVIPPTPTIENELAIADIVISAAGTSAWEICTLGIPALFIAVVENQVASLRAIQKHSLGATLDVTEDLSAFDHLNTKLDLLLNSEQTRRLYAENSVQLFDGKGPRRICDAILTFNF